MFSLNFFLCQDWLFHLSAAYALIWKSDATLRCKIFSWLAVHEKCLTADNLQAKGVPCNPVCSLCHIEQESTVHLMANCSFARTLWDLVLDHCNLPPSLRPLGVIQSLAGWWQMTTNQLPPHQRKAWCSVVQLTWWILWKERNDRIFRHQAALPPAVFCKFRAELLLWHQAGRTRAAALAGRPREPD